MSAFEELNLVAKDLRQALGRKGAKMYFFVAYDDSGGEWQLWTGGKLHLLTLLKDVGPAAQTARFTLWATHRALSHSEALPHQDVTNEIHDILQGKN